jgi:hypothetical protein
MTTATDLIGTWISDPADSEGQLAFGRASLEFRPDGYLVYTIYSDRSEQKMLLTYEVRGATIITDQPSRPQRNETPFTVSSNGKLRLKYEGQEVAYVRAPAAIH